MTIGGDPLPSFRWWGWQREIENGHLLAVLVASTERHDFPSVIEIDAFDANGHPQQLGRKGDHQMFLEQAEKTDALFGFVVRVDGGLLDECHEATFREPWGRRGGVARAGVVTRTRRCNRAALSPL